MAYFTCESAVPLTHIEIRNKGCETAENQVFSLRKKMINF